MNKGEIFDTASSVNKRRYPQSSSTIFPADSSELLYNYALKIFSDPEIDKAGKQGKKLTEIAKGKMREAACQGHLAAQAYCQAREWAYGDSKDNYLNHNNQNVISDNDNIDYCGCRIL